MRIRTRRALVAGLACMVAAVAAGCGSSNDKTASSTSVKTAPAAPSAASVGVKTSGLIAFRRYSDPSQTEGAVFTINPDGSGERQLTHPPKDNVDDQPAFSADGSKVAFERCPTADPKPCRAYVIDRDGSGERELPVRCPLKPASGCDSSGPAWSKDGLLALNAASGKVKEADWGDQIQRSELVVLDPKHGTQRTVALLDRWQGDVGSPAWSPDGRQILFQQQWSPIAKHQGLALFVIPAKGGKARQLTAYEIAGGDHPAWSPDGQWIAFRTHADQDEGESRLRLIHPDGSGLHYLKTPGNHVLSTGFSPDSAWTAVGAQGVAGTYDVYAMRVDGSDLHPITRTKSWDSAPDWGP